jgi:hypothetical protein
VAGEEPEDNANHETNSGVEKECLEQQAGEVQD